MSALPMSPDELSMLHNLFSNYRNFACMHQAGLSLTGFEKGIRSMKVGGKRRLVVSPALGPPVGPSTFFSAKQCEVFDVELLDVKSCRRRQVAMFSDVVCE